MNREEFQTERTRIISEMLDNPDEYGIYPTTKCFEQLDALFDSLSLPPAEGAETEETKEMEAMFDLEQKLNIPMKDRFHNSEKGKALFDTIYGKQQPTAEGAEEILASLIESLGEPDNSIHDHSYEIRPLTVSGKCEWWMFHNGVGSGEPLAQWLQNFATLHAQRIAEKMVEENLVEFGDMIRDEPNGDIAALAEYFIRTINLKSREK